MAPLLRLLLLLALSSAAYARPCIHFHPSNTLLVTYTFSSASSSSDVVVGDPEVTSFGPRRSFAVLRIFRFRPDYSDDAFSRPISHPLPAAIPSLGITSSLQERAKDVLVVVVGLLFGVGCGALTAATMYLAWSLFTNRYEICGYDGYGYDDEEEIESPKKMGYASIPPAPATPASPVKEGN